MSIAVWDLPIAEQLEVAEKKLDLRPLERLGEKMPIYDKNYFLCLMRLYGDTARSLKVAANYTSSGDECGTPSGFELHCSPRAPMWALPFEGRPLGSGLAAFPISVGPDGQRAAQLDVSRMIAERDNIHRTLLATLDNDEMLGGLGDPAAFAGIYWQYTEQRRPTFWAVARAHSPVLSADLLARVREAEPESMRQVDVYVRERIERYARFKTALELRQLAERGEIDDSEFTREEELRELAAGVDKSVESQRQLRVPYTTWDEFFFCDSDVTRIAEAQKLHRARVVALVMRAANVVSDERVNSLDEQIAAIMESPLALDATTNWVDQIDSSNANSSIVFLSNLTSCLSKRTNSSEGGVILQTSPHDEMQLVRGPFHQSRDAIGVPMSTGPVNFIPSVGRQDEAHSAHVVPPIEFAYVPLSPADPSHALFGKQNWRDRFTDTWRSAEKVFVAPESKRSVTPLRAIATRLADPKSSD